MKVDIFNTDKKYSIIYADPPWQYKVWSKDTGLGRSAESHYKTMSKEDIEALPIVKLANKNAVLFLIAAMRGRNPDNPSDRTMGKPTKQRLEIGSEETSNTLTTVQKDNLVVEPSYRIRKLTERECFRLMGVKEKDFERVAKNQSTSSLYHLAGDSIVTTCLMAIFGELFGIDYKTKINELVEDLRQ